MTRIPVIFAILVLPALYAQSKPQSGAQSTNASLEELKKKAAAGDRASQYSLGEDFRLGLGGAAPDGAEAERYYKMAAEQGMPEAQHALAILYYEGDMIPRNYPEALRWFRAAADQGLPESKFYIGVIYDRGLGVPQDYKEAVRWYKIGHRLVWDRVFRVALQPLEAWTCRTSGIPFHVSPLHSRRMRLNDPARHERRVRVDATNTRTQSVGVAGCPARGRCLD